MCPPWRYSIVEQKRIHPNGTCDPRRSNSMVRPDQFAFREDIMEKKWTVSGVFADWTMTVRTEATEERHLPDLPEWQLLNFTQLGQHFHDIVNLCERVQEPEDGDGIAQALMWHAPEQAAKCAFGDGCAPPGVQVAQSGTVGADLDDAKSGAR